MMRSPWSRGARNVIAFDVETDRLLDRTRSNFEALRITVASALRLRFDDGDDEGAADEDEEEGRRATSYFAEPTASSDERPLEDLGILLDAADVVVAYNGRGFDIRVLRNHFPADRVDAWERKLADPFEAMRECTGSWVKLDELLEANALPRKAGDGVCAVEWWAAGERRKVAEYCCADVEGLAAIVAMDRFRFPIKVWKRGVSVVQSMATMDWRAYRQNRGLR
jgi:hypothetical protein